MIHPNDIYQVLKDYWGHSEFRPLQSEIIHSILDQKETIGLLPTGGGKSLCFQLPAIMQNRFTLVVSPLIALIRDQVNALNGRGIPAAGITHEMSGEDIKHVYIKCREGQLKLLYVSPERIQSRQFQQFIAAVNPAFLIVDEAHCISQWGHDFRPSYLGIRRVRSWVKGLKIHAFTATADKKVLKDIKRYLGLKNPKIFRKSYQRENIAFHNIYVEDKLSALTHLLKNEPGCGIIYVRSRRNTENIATYLNKYNIKANFYHAGIESKQRNKTQEDWMKRKNAVMVSTNAFGMGVDKADVRFVIHLDLPENMESYYQEAGRAGRDGLPSKAVVLYNGKDLRDLKDKVMLSLPTQRNIRRVYEKLLMSYVVHINRNTKMPIDFSVLATQLNLPLKTIRKSLELLDKNALIKLDSTQKEGSKLQLLLPIKNLEQIKTRDKSGYTILLAALKLYEGLWAYKTSINEEEIADYLGVRTTLVQTTLHRLSENDQVYYDKHDPAHYYRWNANKCWDNFPGKAYRYQRKGKIRKMKFVLDYMVLLMCRQLYILRYFDENISRTCKKCDICTQDKRDSFNKNSLSLFESELAKLIGEQEMEIDELMMHFPFFEQKKYRGMLELLYHKGKLKIEGKWIEFSELYKRRLAIENENATGKKNHCFGDE